VPGHEEKYVDKSSECVGSGHAVEPDDQQDDESCPEYRRSNLTDLFTALVPHLEIIVVIFQMTHPRQLETVRLFT